MKAQRPYVVVFKGARDQYQTAIALHERQALAQLFTDFYSPLDAPSLPSWLKRRLRKTSLGRRYSEELPSDLVTSILSEAARSAVSLRWGTTAGDERIGRLAARAATDRDCALLAYSYYASSAFREYRGLGPKVLFQVQPHALLAKKILQAAADSMPVGRSSISNELEFDERLGDRIAEEAFLADRVICNSQISKRSLLFAGLPEEKVAVIPYGVDLQTFRPEVTAPTKKRFTVLFVGQLIGRKGLYQLLEAWRRLRLPDADLVLAGNNPDNEILEKYKGLYTLHVGLRRSQLVPLYQQADLFCFPSVLEGFGLVILEALACGTPVLTTENVGLADEIGPAGAGFVIPPNDIDALCERLEWCSTHRDRLMAMRRSARRLAEQHSWQDFRASVAKACL